MKHCAISLACLLTLFSVFTGCNNSGVTPDMPSEAGIIEKIETEEKTKPADTDQTVSTESSTDSGNETVTTAAKTTDISETAKTSATSVKNTVSSTSGTVTANPKPTSPTAATGTDDEIDEDDDSVYNCIDKDGTYRISGRIDGQILVSAENVTLILDGAYIVCTDGSAILGKDGNGSEVIQQLVIELRGENTVVSDEKHGIQGNDDLTVTGKGKLNITALKNGLHAGDLLNVNDGNISIKANRGIQATKLSVVGGSIGINAENDGIRASVGENSAKTPEISITGGSIDIKCAKKGVSSTGTVNIKSGTVKVNGIYYS